LLPLNFLKQIIGLYGNSMQTFVPQYLEAAMDAFQRNQSAVRDAFGTSMLADIAKRNMALFEDAAQAFAGKARSDAKAGSEAAPTAGKSPNKEVDALRAELEALQAKVDRLSR
jgi:polyhydroxyalkanoate synthesis regulator protein